MDLLAEAARLAEAECASEGVSAGVSECASEEVSAGGGGREAVRQRDYLRELLRQQERLCAREEEQCALLASLLLRAHLKSLTERAFCSAFRKKNVPADEVKSAATKPAKGSGKRTSESSDKGAPSAKKGKLAKEKKDKEKVADPEEDVEVKQPRSRKKPEPTPATKKARQALRKESSEKIYSALVAKKKAQVQTMTTPSESAGEAARILGEQLLQRLNSAPARASTTKAMLGNVGKEVSLNGTIEIEKKQGVENVQQCEVEAIRQQQQSDAEKKSTP